MQKILLIHPNDNLIVALKPLSHGEQVSWNGSLYTLVTDVPAKHKFAIHDLNVGDIVYMYGVPVGKATHFIKKGQAVTTQNIKHYAAPIELDTNKTYQWTPPDISKWSHRTFNGYIRKDGRIGTANYWLILPLVFCQNRNVLKLQESLAKPLGYETYNYESITQNLLNEHISINTHIDNRPFQNIDGIRAITVNSGCGGTSNDAISLCKILAAYADHPNVAGITVFALGCEKSQVEIFNQQLKLRNPHFDKPYLFFRQQEWANEQDMMQDAIKKTFTELKIVNQINRQPVSISKLKIGVKCGGSDGFSGISANPAMGIVSDIIVAIGGGSALAEFPELCGAEGEIVSRCIKLEDKKHFLELMNRYESQANLFNASIADNPSPGNIKDGLITDAIKSAGAAKKGGSAPITAVVDYGDPMPEKGLSLVCTPGNDLEAVTGQVASGVNVVIFSTGLGTPTGNPIVPVLKISSNSITADQQPSLIDFDCGPVIDGVPLNHIAEELLEKVIQTASGEYQVKADRLEQYDFLFWKREVSL